MFLDLLPLLVTNYTEVIGDFWNWSLQGYFASVGLLFYPIFFGGVIGYVYTKQQSVVAAAVAILVIITAFAGIFADADTVVVMVLHLMTAFIISGLFLIFIIKVRGK